MKLCPTCGQPEKSHTKHLLHSHKQMHATQKLNQIKLNQQLRRQNRKDLRKFGLQKTQEKDILRTKIKIEDI